MAQSGERSWEASLADAYSVLDVIYFLNKSKESISRSEFELPQFVLIDVKFTSKIEKLISGDYSRLVCVFLFQRNIGFYIIQIYLPSILIVVISWVSFWLNRDATPARVALGVTTVLTMTTLTTTTNAAMPKVSYVKSIDIFLGVSFLMVFSSLLEYAAVGYISKRMKLVAKRKSAKKSVPTKATPSSPISFPTYLNRCYRPFYSSCDRTSNLFYDNHKKPPVLLKADQCQCPLPPSQSSYHLKQFAEIIDDEGVQLSFFNIPIMRPSAIDKYSRSVFPLIFIVFNTIYWAYYYNISGTELQETDF